MSQIITYKHDKKYGYCQIKLDSGESVLLSESSEYIKIFKVIFGTIPTKTIWKWHRINDPKEQILKMMNNHPDNSFFDSFVKEIQEYHSTNEIREKFCK